MAAPARICSEWSLVRCEERNKEEPFFSGKLRAVAAIGNQSDRAHCLFCCSIFTGKVEYVRGHVAGVTGCGVQICKGVMRQPDEDDFSFSQRVMEFDIARAGMMEKLNLMKEDAGHKGTNEIRWLKLVFLYPNQVQSEQ